MPDITIDYRIQTADAARSSGELRRSLRELLSAQNDVNTSTAAGRAEFTRLQEAINRTEGRVGDLQDSFSTLRGSGVERLSGSLSLLQQGFLNADPGQLTIGMQGLRAAMAAVPIFLLIEGAKLLWENFDKVKEVLFGTTNEVENQANAMKALQTQQDATKASLDAYVESLNKQLETLALTNGPLALQLELLKERTNVQVDAVNAEIKAREESIKTTEAQIAANKEALRTTQLQAAGVSLSYETQVKSANDALEAQIKKDKTELANLKSLQVTKDNIIATGNAAEKKAIQDAIDAEEAAWKKRQAALDKFIADRIAARERERLFNEGGDAEAAAFAIKTETAAAEQVQTVREELFIKSIERGKREFQIEQDDLKKSYAGRLQLLEQQKNAELATVSSNSEAAFIIEKKYADMATQEKIKASQQYVAYAQSALSLISGLNELANQSENQKLQQQTYTTNAQLENLNNRNQEEIDRETLKTNQLLNNDQLTAEQREQIAYDSETRKRELDAASANAELAIKQNLDAATLKSRKEQFEKNKKLQLATGIINTAASVLQTFASVPYPLSIPLAIAAGAAGVIQTTIISNKKFDDGGAGARATIIPPAKIDTRGGTSSGGSSPSPTQFNPQGLNSENVNINGEKVGGNRIGVYEGDIRKALTRVDVYETRAAFGRTK